jgi:transcriptional regulator with GAF, ATPase, and Fis domain
LDRARDFEVQHKLLLLETLYDVGVYLGTLPAEENLVEDTLSRAVAVLDASRGYLVTFDEQGGRRCEARVGIARRPTDAVLVEEPILRELARSAEALLRRKQSFLRNPFTSLAAAPIVAAGNFLGALVLLDKEARRGASGGFEEEDRRFLTSLASLCGSAIARRREVERLERTKQSLEEENRRLRDETGRQAGRELFVGESPGVLRVLELVQRVAPSKISVLISGESGTGKELVARMIHARSGRAEKPFVAINCAAVPESLLEAELFGIERGVATGVEARAGRFEFAQGGTLFLDEVGDMPAALQAKLLRVLQEREIERVGGRRRIPMDVRVLAATHADLSRRISAGEFREDLYYRLRVVEILLPPLRERREDILRLARYFLDRFAVREGKGRLTLDRDAAAALMRHPFPGNVRELENVLEGAAALCRGSVIREADLQWVPAASAGASASPATEEVAVLSLRSLEARQIQRALALSGGNKSRAARMLGIHRRTLYRKHGVK